MPAALVMGTRVFVCDNLAFNGEVKLSCKHTQGDDVIQLNEGCLCKL